jgi:mannan endo-1,4-beta-mannosidase
MTKTKGVFILTFLLFFAANTLSADEKQLSDTKATVETKALFKSLDLPGENRQILFGQQDATVMGHIWADTGNTHSDLKDITGSFPAVIGAGFPGLSSNDAVTVENAKNNIPFFFYITQK